MLEEAKRIVEEGAKSGIVLRLLGGLAVKYYCPSASHCTLSREYPDMDLMGLSDQSRKMQELFVNLGYTADEVFNMMQGDLRLLFLDSRDRHVDIFLDIFDMCHKFDFRDRLALTDFAISISDLLITKLQIAELNEKDVKDILSILLDNQIGHNDSAKTINAKYIADLCSHEWGVYKTFTITLNSVLSSMNKYGLGPENEKAVRSRINELLVEIESKPKSARWKIRARLGEKKAWYALPENPTVKMKVR